MKSGRTRSAIGLAILVFGGSLFFGVSTRTARAGTRPLPAFRGVRFFNATRKTQPTTVKETHTGSPTPATLSPASPLPNGAAMYTPSTSDLMNVRQVTVVIDLPAVPGGTATKITVNAVLPSGAPLESHIVEVDVILSDDTSPNVKAEARMLWHQPTGPYWNWDAVTGISPSKPSPNDVTTSSANAWPLTEATLFDGTSTSYASPSISYLPGGTALTATSLTETSPFTIGPTYATDVTSATASAGTIAPATLSVTTAAQDHIHIAYFIVQSSGPPIIAGGIVQSNPVTATAPYWYFK